VIDVTDGPGQVIASAAVLVGETERYHKLRLQLFRLRPGDLAAPGLFPDR
jgi:hypothetical protein